MQERYTVMVANLFVVSRVEKEKERRFQNYCAAFYSTFVIDNIICYAKCSDYHMEEAHQLNKNCLYSLLWLLSIHQLRKLPVFCDLGASEDIALDIAAPAVTEVPSIQ